MQFKNIGRRSKKIKLISWILAVAWMVVIFLLSAQPAEQSDGLSKGITEVIIKVVGAVYPLNVETSTNQNWFDMMNGIVREYAHGIAYFMLSLFTLNAFRSSGARGFKAFMLTFALCAIYALTDEIHQIFVPGRACELVDFVVDYSGALTGSLIFMLATLSVRYMRHRTVRNI